ncbi:MAG: Ppx/GppA phosphatase family protein [Burkholderiaceae bacterium]
MFAAVDLGSNSFRLHIGMPEGEGFRIVRSLRDPIRLAAGLDRQSRLTPDAIRKALDSLSRFRAVLKEYQLDAVRVVATNTLRVARNAAEFLPAAEKAIGHPIEIISGEEEGRLIYMGVTTALGGAAARKLVIDIGGGSTEVIVGSGYETEIVESFTIGTAGQTAAFFDGGRIDAAAYDAAILSARSVFEDAAPVYRALPWAAAYGSSGTIRAIADVIEKNRLGSGALDLPGLDALRQRFVRCGRVDRFDLDALKPERAAVMVGGLAILIGAMEELGIGSLSAVDAGLRMGVLRDLQLRATRHDRREESVLEMARRFHADETRAGDAARIATEIHAMLKPADPGHGRYLRWAGWLHEIGMAVSHSGYHKHGAYLVEHADMPGFTTGEQGLMSLLVLGQKGNLRKIADSLKNADVAKSVLALRLAVLFMHARMDVAAMGLRVRMKGRIDVDVPREHLQQHPTLRLWLEKEAGWWREVGIEFALTAA